MRSTLRAIWFLFPDPLSEKCEVPFGPFGFRFATPFPRLNVLSQSAMTRYDRGNRHAAAESLSSCPSRLNS